MSAHEIRPARPDERPALIEVQRRASLTHEAYRALLLQNPDAIDLLIEPTSQARTLTATVDAVVAGFAVVGKANTRFGTAVTMHRRIAVEQGRPAQAPRAPPAIALAWHQAVSARLDFLTIC